MRVGHGGKCFSMYHLILTAALEVNPSILSILWVRKLRHGEVKYFGQAFLFKGGGPE